MLSFLISAAWETPLGKYSVVTYSNYLSECAVPSLMVRLKICMKRSFGVWMPSWKYVYIFLRRVACLVGYNFMIYSTCHTPKESSVLFLFWAKHCILYCVFIGLSKYYTNGHCFPKRLLFKRWIFFVFSPSPTPPFSPSPLTSHHPHRTH